MAQGRASRLTITLTPAERAALERWQRARRLPAAQVRRGRIVLLRAAGLSLADIGRLVGVSRKGVYGALRRFLAGGLAGLPQQPRRRGRRILQGGEPVTKTSGKPGPSGPGGIGGWPNGPMPA